ncbi:LPXTG cell wall anchor domain-containing protein [Stackebrandtia nassauensis]|uniref:Uncharacterized protein n=1 Tax=Stackebrandtia nassauensis (strain DSM 44728 / CIP 108903 / NRRL B-16338 / NBRC 102104 / LLR-40K-21) TaxID=446470 RepID=D3Q6K7_STANL|nr:LPXTG cell wall anchor domain-containing protein [Stackebrandtia nassauensis]ADD44250.1 hypothetical protein Snas_4606 [Stackebrandtia nassauensis DSM 44728]
MKDLIAAIVEFPTVLFVVVGVAALVGAGVLVTRRRRVPRPDGERADLVGKTCVIREDGQGTGRAEVTDAEGATRVIRIRPAPEVRPNAETLRSGSSALIYDYDNTGGFFVVAPLAKKPERAE